MLLKDYCLSKIKNIIVKRCSADSLINSQEYLNSESTFKQYLDYDCDKYFSGQKNTNWPK
jgi:hypothetical protein